MGTKFSLWLIAGLLAVSLEAKQNDTKGGLASEADAAFAQKQPSVALKRLESASPEDYELQWRLSRAWLLTGDEQTSESEKERHYQQALQAAERALKARPDGPMGFLRRAAANGKIALYLGPLKSKDAVNRIRQDCESALALPSITDEEKALGHYILGRMHLKLTETPIIVRKPLGLGWGKLSDAIENLKTAVALKPQIVSYRLEYGKALAKNSEPDAAKAQWQAAAALPGTDHGDEERKAELKALFRP